MDVDNGSPPAAETTSTQVRECFVFRKRGRPFALAPAYPSPTSRGPRCTHALTPPPSHLTLINHRAPAKASASW